MAIGTAGAIIGGSLIGGLSSAIGGSKAAGAAKDASAASIAEQRRQFDLLRSDQAPYRALGNAALDTIGRLYGYGSLSAPPPATQPTNAMMPVGDMFRGASMFGGGRFDAMRPTLQPSTPATGAGKPDLSAFWASPDYQFNLGEGQKAIDRSLAARGRALSGAGVREGVRFASGMASNEFSNFYNRLASQAGIGQSSVQNTGAAGMQSAANIGNALMNAGNARANAYMQGAQGVNNAAQGGIGNWLLYKYLGQS